MAKKDKSIEEINTDLVTEFQPVEPVTIEVNEDVLAADKFAGVRGGLR